MAVNNPFSSNSHRPALHRQHGPPKGSKFKQLCIAFVVVCLVAATFEMGDISPIKPSELQEAVVSSLQEHVGPIQEKQSSPTGGLRGRSKFTPKKQEDDTAGDTHQETDLSGEKDMEEVVDVSWSDPNNENTEDTSDGRVTNQALTDATKGLIEQVDESLKEVDESLKEVVEDGAFGRGKDAADGESDTDAKSDTDKHEVKVVGKKQTDGENPSQGKDSKDPSTAKVTTTEEIVKAEENVKVEEKEKESPSTQDEINKVDNKKPSKDDAADKAVAEEKPEVSTEGDKAGETPETDENAKDASPRHDEENEEKPGETAAKLQIADSPEGIKSA